MPLSEEDMVAQLRRLGYQVSSPPRTYPPRRCHVCGVFEEDVLYSPQSFDLTGIDIDDDIETAEWLTTFVLQTNPGEEGYDKVVLHFCENHELRIIEQLAGLGFQSHHHGGTATLVDRSCVGERDYGACPQGTRRPYELSDEGVYIS